MSTAPSRSQPKPFLFDRSFDDLSKVYLPGEKFGPKIEVDLPKPKGDEAPNTEGEAEGEQSAIEAAPPPPEKKYTEDDLEAAREEGHIAGHTEALEDAETAREHYVADAMNLISTGLDGLAENQANANQATGEVALRMVYAVVEKVLPDHAKDYAMESLEGLMREILPLVYDEPTLVVRVHNMVADDVQTKLEEVCERSNFNGSIRVVPDYELQPGDCRVEWEGGGADRNEARLWGEIREIIRDNIGPVDLENLDQAADAEAENQEQEKVETQTASETDDRTEEIVVESGNPADGGEPTEEPIDTEEQSSPET